MTGHSLVVTGARVTHERASVDALDAASGTEPTERLEALLGRDAVEEAFVLRTCHRIEEYVVTPAGDAGHEALADFAPALADDAVTWTGHEESLRHLLRVAAGLESQVLGEDQILGQVRDAYDRAQEVGAIGEVLEAALLKAIHVGERARTETAINEGTVSLGGAAVELAGRDRDLAGATALVVGAGEMGALVAEAFAAADVGEVRIVNRTPERAAAVAEELPVPARGDGLDALPENVAAADVVVSSTGSAEPVIDRAAAAGAGETLFIDIAQPRDVDPAVESLEGATVRDLDGLEAITERTHAERREAAAAVEALIDEEFDLLMEQYKRARADAVIRGMYQGAERVKERELARALGELEDLDAEERAVVEDLADALVSQLMAVPTESLREAAAEDDWNTIATAIDLFNPHSGEVADMFEAMPAPEDAADSRN